MRKTRYVVAALAAGVIAAVAFAAVAGAQPAKKQADSLSGAGSTFVAPLIAQWQGAYKDATIIYNPVGSGAGITAIQNRTVDFGASDAPLTVDQFISCHGCVMVPWALGATAVLYNLPGVKNNLHLTGKVIAGIYLGKITKWNDPAITKLNKGVNLPSTDITPVNRSDGSGTTYNFTDYLSAVSPEWSSRVGHNTAVDWPSPKAVGARGSSGVSGVVTRTPGAVGYADVAYALANKLQFAAVQNKSGKFALPGIRGIESASANVRSFDSRNFISIVNPPKSKANAYPICTYTFVILPLQTPKAAALKAFVNWAITSGQPLGKKLLFVPIPSYVLARDKAVLKRIGST